MTAARIVAILAAVLIPACSDAPGGGPPERGPQPGAGSGDAVEHDIAESDAAGDTTDDAGDDPADDGGGSSDDVTDRDAADGSGDDAGQDDAEGDALGDTDGEDAPPEDGADDTAAEDTAPEDTAPDGPEVVRFILIGDFGEDNAEQHAVAAAAAAHCDANGGCHGIVSLGDNIYDEGPDSATDPQFEAYMDVPYRVIKYGPPPGEGEDDTRERAPMYVSLGNHDLGGAGLDASLAAHFVEYGAERDWFYFPSRYWERRVGPVHLVALDTNPLAYLGTETAQQGRLIDDVVASTDARWTLVFGHHPYRSNGDHGNAGSYEGVPGDLVFLGGRFREFVDTHICNKVDFYICGHEHNRQWMASVPRFPTWPVFPAPPATFVCGTEFAVSGAGAKDDDLVDRDNDLAFGSPHEGFLYMEFGPDEATAQFVSMAGEVEWTEVY